MQHAAFFARATLAFVLTTTFSFVLAGVGGDFCPEAKGPCCDLDWTGQGATIVKREGDVMVSNSPYVNAAVGMRVNNGGRVMTLDGGTAVVAYDDGCWHVLTENKVLTIENFSPCCAAAAPPPPPPPVVAPAPNLLWVPPALIAGGLIAREIWDDDDDDDPPPPPISR